MRYTGVMPRATVMGQEAVEIGQPAGFQGAFALPPGLLDAVQAFVLSYLADVAVERGSQREPGRPDAEPFEHPGRIELHVHCGARDCCCDEAEVWGDCEDC